MAQNDDPVASAKAFLSDSEKKFPTAAKHTPGGGKRDIDLPNASGVADSRLTKRPVEQPRGVASNVALRRSLTGGGRR